MNTEERIVNKFLINQGYKLIESFPLGKNNPPDFLIYKRIAVEVRRLNKFFDINGRFERIDKVEYSFVPKFRTLLKEFEHLDLKYSVSVALMYQRPLRSSKKLIEDLKKSITSSTQSEHFGVNIVFNDKITYTLYKCDYKNLDQTFKLCSVYDRDKGGEIQNVRYNALRISIEEKTEKINGIKHKYSEFWLILVDDISTRFDESIRSDLKRFPEIISDFNRILMQTPKTLCSSR